MTSTKKRTAAALTATILTVALAAPTLAAKASAESIRISSYKGSTLEVGERSGLIIGPSGTDYSVTSSDPDTVAVEQVQTFWVAVAKAEGDHCIQQCRGSWNCNADGRLRLPRCAGSTYQRRQRQPDRQPGDPAGNDPAHQPDP